MFWAFMILGLGSVACAWTLILRGHPLRKWILWNAAGNFFFEVGFSTDGYPVSACISSALFTLDVYVWWNRGGGDDTKRRLKSVWKGFSPVRRTAPV